MGVAGPFRRASLMQPDFAAVIAPASHGEQRLPTGTVGWGGGLCFFLRVTGNRPSLLVSLRTGFGASFTRGEQPTTSVHALSAAHARTNAHVGPAQSTGNEHALSTAFTYRSLTLMAPLSAPLIIGWLFFSLRASAA